MELKFNAEDIIKAVKQVLIAPLWNWNEGAPVKVGAATVRSNRTFMELKFKCYRYMKKETYQF